MNPNDVTFCTIVIASYLMLVESCTSFYCVNSCGASKIDSNKKGFKLVLANNRDENIYRQTWPANVWPSKKANPLRASKQAVDCDQSQDEPPFNLCVYGALDTARNKPPDYYSTWLGINERGSVGNLLFFMSTTSYPEVIPRGVVVGNYLQNSSWHRVEDYMQQLTNDKKLYKPYNYVQLEMSKDTGRYSLYYVNNNDTEPYKKMNPDEENMFTFGLSNSDPDRPFNKVKNNKINFEKILEEYSLDGDKEKLLNKLLYDLLQNDTANMPDATLKAFLGTENAQIIEGLLLS
jgi:uncharacterized protein with NRDE domain